MNAIDRKLWSVATERLNADRTIKLGDQVTDGYGDVGVVVKIVIPDSPSVKDDGTIYVWQSERTGYGSDNCEHYVWFGWKRLLRINSVNVVCPTNHI